MNKSKHCYLRRYRRALALALASAVIPPASLLEELDCRPRKIRGCCNE